MRSDLTTLIAENLALKRLRYEQARVVTFGGRAAVQQEPIRWPVVARSEQR
jgi:hypothetical protein